MNKIQREIKFNIGERNFTAKFPNVGQMIDIESLKQALTNNSYGTMCASGVKSMYIALDLVDAVSFFQICVPQVEKYFNIKNYADLQLDEIKNIVDAYLLQIKPWFNDLVKQLYSINKQDEDNKQEGISEGTSK